MEAETKWSYCTCDGEHHNFIKLNGVFVCEECKKPIQYARQHGTKVTQSLELHQAKEMVWDIK